MNKDEVLKAIETLKSHKEALAVSFSMRAARTKDYTYPTELDDFELAITALQAQLNDGWISVEDRLPIIPKNAARLNSYKKCVVSDECKNVKECYFIRKTVRGKQIERWEEPSGRMPHRKITHWMPLPQPPEGKPTMHL